MRILLASRNFFPANTVGGAQVSIRLLGQALQAAGHDVAVLSVDDSSKAGLHEASGLYEYRLKLANLYSRGAAPAHKKLIWHTIDRFGHRMDQQYEEVLRDFRPDVVNTNVLAAMGLGIWRAARQCSVPVIHTVHDYYLMCLRSGMRKADTNCSTPCMTCRISSLYPSRREAPTVREVIYVSKHMSDTHKRLEIFPPETGTSIIAGSYRPARPIQVRAGTAEPGILSLGYFGRISPEKGIALLIRALAKLPSEGWKLTVGGGGDPDYVKQMQELAQGLPVHFIGVVSPDEFYASVDAVVISSLWHDPAPRVAYEAGIHGVVPIVANRGGLPDLVGNGTRGFIFDPDDPSSLTGQLSRLIHQPSELVAMQGAWSSVAQTFDPQFVAGQTLEIYERAARKRG